MKKEEFISELQLKAKSINLELSDKKAELLYEYKNLVYKDNADAYSNKKIKDNSHIEKYIN